MKYGIIYKLTNKINSKVYIGKTVQIFKRRCRPQAYKSCTALHNSIQVHGWDNFEKEEFICSLSEDYLAGLEEDTIKHFDCMAPKGYNIIQIDKGLNRYTDETKAKISDSRKEYLKSLDSPLIPKNRKQSVLINGILCRQCNFCKEQLPHENFAKSKDRWDGLAVICKTCFHKKYNSKPDPRRLTPEQFKESYKGRQDPEKQRQPYINNPEMKARIAKATSKAIVATCIETGKQSEYSSAREAQKVGFNNSCISTAIKNKTVYKKHTWRFK